MPEREFLRSEYYNDFLRKFDVCYHLAHVCTFGL